MKNPNLVIDVGQTFIKFVVIDNYKVIDHVVLDNRLLVKKKILNYNISKLKRIIFSNTKKILKKYNIKKIIPITHGSASFFMNKNDECFSGPHFLQRTSNSFDKEFFNIIKKNDYTHSIKLNCFHNLGKSFYYLIKNQKKLGVFKIFTFPSFINYLLTGKLYLDKSYLGCHSFSWNFKKSELISFFNNHKKFFPKVIQSGKEIGFLKRDLNTNSKIKVFNGIHDTSGSYLVFNQNVENKDSLIINTGTYFVISRKTKFSNILSKNFYLNYGADNNLYLCKRVNAGLIFQKYNPKMLFKKKKFNKVEINMFYRKNDMKKITKLKMIKNKSQITDYLRLNLFIAQKLSHEIKNFCYDNKKIHKIFIDGNFVKNKAFIYFLSRLVDCKIYLNNNSYINCIGASTFLINKRLNLKYEKLNHSYFS